MDFRGANMIESEMRDRLVAKNADIDRLRTENATLSAQLASHQIDIDTFREGNMQLRAQLAKARADYAAALSALELANMPTVPEEAMYLAVELLAEANTRAEQAEAALAAANDRISSYADAGNNLLTELSAANARVAELERDIAAKANNMRYMHDRFERAEAERDALDRAFKALGADMANLGRERNALREALEKISSCNVVHAGDVVDIARAALATSPAKEE